MMALTKEKALQMLDEAPQSATEISKINPGITQFQWVDIIRKAIERMKPGETITGIYELRVWQSYLNQKRPNY